MTNVVLSATDEKIVELSPDEIDRKEFEQIPKPKASPLGPTGYQKVVNIVEGSKGSRPGVYWFQIDDGSWVAETYRGDVHSPNRGTRSDPAPSAREVKDKIEMSRPEYMPVTYIDQYDNPVNPINVTDAHIAKVESTQFQNVNSLITKLELTPLKTAVILTSITGRTAENPMKYEYAHNRKYGENPDGVQKNEAMYPTPLHITWRGKLVEQKKIRLTGTQRLAVDEEANLTGEVATMSPGEASYGNWVDISTRSGVEWKSDQSGVVEVNPSGKIKGVSPGTAKISVRWKSGDPYQYDLIAYLNVTVGDGPIQHDPDGKAACSPTINPPNEVASPQTAFMDPGAQGHILADDPTNGIHFDATRGIPTSEHLYANTWAMNYLFQHTFGKQQGTITYNCEADLTYVRTWKVEQPDLPGPDGTMIPQEDTEDSDTVDVHYTFSFERNYSYWNINNVELYSIDQAEMENYALPDDERITLYPQGYTPPELEMEHDEDVEIHVMPKETGEISYVPPVLASDGYEPLDVPDDKGLLKGMAEGQTGPPDVKNDALDFTWEGASTKVMDGSTVVENGPDPTQIPAPTKIGSYKDTGEQVLYEDQLLIPQTRLNKANTESSGEIQYALHPTTLGGSGDKTFPVSPINTVTVHTPVVNYSLVSDDQPHNQKTVPNMNRSALILERPFTVRIPTNGQHLDAGSYPGYGDRDYAKYYRIKQVRFPFDVYSADRTQFYPRNTWIDIDVPVLDTTFYLPVWVDEGDYQVEFRNIAENAPSEYPMQPEIEAQPDANTDLYYHVASDEVSVEVIGRLYDFEITDIADYNWELVFRRFKGSIAPTWISYWTGTQDIDGDKRGNFSQFTVPIRPGSHPLQGYQNVAVKTGYHFKFDFKTKGNMFGPRDGIRLTPTFDFVSKDGRTRVPVDLYYSTNQRNFIRIGSAEDQVKRFVILNDRMRQVPAVQLRDTATYKYHRYGEIHTGMMSERAYQEYYRDKFTKMKTPVGGYSLLLMPEQLRTFIGPKTNIPTTASADVLRANAAIQQWYGEYSLPAEPYVVEAGTNLAEYGRTHGGLDAKSPIFLKNGYIVVNFNFESIREGNLGAPHLQYIHAPLMNQWLLEGFQRQVQDSYGNSFSLRDGDVVFYHASRSSRDDFSAQVPH
ncbi:DUF5704 domain-containing protein [Paenibacillus polysaccharolyticus]|uniref:DUF5704 domain-containing protein n=1 Tax=Paenibacillus polysaccharolyticus TaxID=582692 RepID=UPI00280A76CF|nr:DUF5704 domain-containing protein [Paenibacillus polysaccharolyticus]